MVIALWLCAVLTSMWIRLDRNDKVEEVGLLYVELDF